MRAGRPRGGDMAASELGDILRAIREVESNLEHRAERAGGAVMVTWGVAVAAIFLFYHVVDLNPDPWVAAMGPFLAWAWLVPVAGAYVASLAAGARAGRLARSAEQQRAWRRSLLLGTVPSAVAAALVAFGQGERIPGAVLLWLPAACYFASVYGRGAVKPASRALSVVAGALGILLIAWPASWSSLAAAAVYGIGLAGLGTLQYATAR